MIICALITFVCTSGCESAAFRRDASTDDRLLKDGDVLFQDSHSSQSEDIKAITHSSYCHVGVYFRQGNTGYVYHAGSQVQRVTFADWVGNGKGFGA